MKVPDEGLDQPIAWTAILEHTPVIASDGVVVGTVTEVLGAEDIFHGLVLLPGDSSGLREIEAVHVTEITNRKIAVNLTSLQVREIPVYQPEQHYGLGIVGRFRKHLGWIEEDERPG